MNDNNVLLVEDDLFLRDVYCESLQSASITFEVAVDGQDALTKITSHTWGLILLDDVMPKLSGIQVVESLRKDNPKGKWNIVFLTNSHDIQDITKIKEFGYECVFKSEITPDDLVLLVEKHLQRASA